MTETATCVCGYRVRIPAESAHAPVACPQCGQAIHPGSEPELLPVIATELPKSAFQSAERPATIWMDRMDRLSDRIGSLIPGGSRLPPRHPVKVSLVMGFFGYLSGWLTVLPWLGFFFLFFFFFLDTYTNYGFTFINIIIFITLILTSFSMFGLVVLVPIWLWCGRRVVPSVLVNGLLSILIHVAGFAAGIGAYNLAESNHWPGSPIVSIVCLVAPHCAVISLGFALYVTRIARCRAWQTISVAVVLGTLIGVLSISVLALPFQVIDRLQVGAELRLAASIASLGFPLSIFHTVLACCFGIPLWDTTPLPKFEPAETSPSPEPNE